MPWLANSAVAESISAMSIYCPSPVRSRWLRAARMAVAEYMPVMMSMSATPTRSGPAPGSPSAGPVMLIMPPMACRR